MEAPVLIVFNKHVHCIQAKTSKVAFKSLGVLRSDLTVESVLNSFHSKKNCKPQCWRPVLGQLIVSGNDLPCAGPALVCFIFSYFSLRLLKKHFKRLRVQELLVLPFQHPDLPAAFSPLARLALPPGSTPTCARAGAPLAKHSKRAFCNLEDDPNSQLINRPYSATNPGGIALFLKENLTISHWHVSIAEQHLCPHGGSQRINNNKLCPQTLSSWSCDTNRYILNSLLYFQILVKLQCILTLFFPCPYAAIQFFQRKHSSSFHELFEDFGGWHSAMQ